MSAEIRPVIACNTRLRVIERVAWASTQYRTVSATNSTRGSWVRAPKTAARFSADTRGTLNQSRIMTDSPVGCPNYPTPSGPECTVRAGGFGR
ncbi:hypothetical protein GCM10011576_24030 [Micromonospora parathelypteridis]|nr:hypothetical protein GCM10011576_24030 [Micromonospora parathelypteridis]